MINLEESKEKAIEVLRTIYDPEMPVNIYDLGLIYNLELIQEPTKVIAKVLMTLTSPNCPVADSLTNEVFMTLRNSPYIDDVDLQLTFDPPWDPEQMSDEVKLDLGLL